MPIIKPRTHGRRFVRERVILDCQNEDTLCAYAAFIEDDPHYVVNALIEMVLGRDREFQAWRAEHPEASVPLARRRSSRPASTVDRLTSVERHHNTVGANLSAPAGQRE
jgi:hypothetical protein